METPPGSDAIQAAGAHDPHQPPRVDLGLQDPDLLQAEQTRRELLNHEVSVKSIGTLYYLSAALLLFAGIAILASAPVDAGFLAGGAAYVALALPFILLARGLRRLSPRVRVPVTILSVIGLLVVPLGTLINGYILYLVHSAKGRRVMTPEYAAIIARTPHIRYRTSGVVLKAFVLLILLFLAVLLPAMRS